MNIHAKFGREEAGGWIAEIPQLPESRASGATRREAAIGVTIRAFHILADRIESGELKVEDEPEGIILGGTADTLTELLVELRGRHIPITEPIRAVEERVREGLKSFDSVEQPQTGSSVAEECDNFAAAPLTTPRTLADYHRLRDMLEALIERVGADDSHPMAAFMERVGTLVEQYESTHLAEIIESKQKR
jgi:predicted RNase H-like HicB family nuclease